METIENNDLEEQFILRLPQNKATYIRNILETKPKHVKKVLDIQFDNNMRTAIVRVKRTMLHGKLTDLPTVIESNKTLDSVNLYKTADICQMLICQKDPFEGIDKENIAVNVATKKPMAKEFRSEHGLSAPMKNVRRLRMRKTLLKEESEDTAEVEKELLYLLRMDLEAVSSRFELVDDPAISKYQQISEQSIFGDISDCSSDLSNCNDIMEYTN